LLTCHALVTSFTACRVSMFSSADSTLTPVKMEDLNSLSTLPPLASTLAVRASTLVPCVVSAGCPVYLRERVSYLGSLYDKSLRQDSAAGVTGWQCRCWVTARVRLGASTCERRGQGQESRQTHLDVWMDVGPMGNM
jgi:hypothetical protein